MIEGHEDFYEECWVIYGYDWDGIKLGLMLYEAEGTASSVDFDWKRVMKNAKYIMGFNHTHPEGHSIPSAIDDETMKGWVKALGRPLICGIKNGDWQRFFIYERDDAGKVQCREISFKQIGNFILTGDWAEFSGGYI